VKITSEQKLLCKEEKTRRRTRLCKDQLFKKCCANEKFSKWIEDT